MVGGVACSIMFAIKQIPGAWNLRLDRDGELEGLDIHEHGTPAYHMEFGQGLSYTTSTGQAGNPCEDPYPSTSKAEPERADRIRV